MLACPAPSFANLQIKLSKENLSSAQIAELRTAMKTRAEKILSEVSRLQNSPVIGAFEGYLVD